MKKEENKLPKKFKKDWIKALRSGEYNQAEGALYIAENNGYCCLGVACRVAGYTRADLKSKGKANYASFIIKKQYQLDREFKKIPDIIKGEDDNSIVSKLSQMNDEGISFKEIADYIEKNL